jgi:competence protein ComEC
MRTIAAIPAGALLAGSACGLLFADPPFVLGYVLLSASGAGATFAWALRLKFLFALLIALGFFAGGVLLSSTDWQRAWRPSLRLTFEELARHERETAGRRLPEDDSAFAVLHGVLRSDAAATDTGVSLSVMVDSIEHSRESSVIRLQSRLATDDWRPATEAARGGVLVTVVGSIAAARTDEWRAGRRVRFPVQLRRPSRYLDPGVPDYERALARRGTTLVGTVKSGALVEVVAPGSWIDERLGAVRAFARRAIRVGVGQWSPASAAIVGAIVIGDRAGLGSDIERRLQEAGTYHVIAISGGNIAILVGLLLGAFRIAGWLGRAAMLAAIALLIVYARLVGGGASVDRATLMAVVYLGARALGQRTPPLNALAFIAGVLVAADPLSIADPAFVLTFGATLAIVVVAPAVAAWQTPALLRPLLTLFAASIAAEAMLFPVGAVLFSRVTFAGLGLNFLAIPLMAVAQVAGMAVVPLALFSSRLAAMAGLPAHAGAAGLVWSARLVRLAPLLAYRVAPPSGWVVALYYAAAIGAWILWRHHCAAGSGADADLAARVFKRPGVAYGFVARHRSSVIALRATVGLAVASGSWVLTDPRALMAGSGDGLLHATFLDVGQGDAMLVRFPRGATLLVDTGGLAFSSSFDIGERVVAPVVRDAGFYRLEHMALTHGDPDHIGGAMAVLEEFRPREVWEGIPVPRSEPLTALRAQTQASGSRWVNVYRGDRRSIDDVDVVVWHPAPADWERQRPRNDDSIVLELRRHDVSIVLTGDIGRAVEATLARDIPAASLRVIKVPHHGSLTSSTREFIDAMRPRIAIVSAGRANRFGHPAPEVLERYRAGGAEIFRTDQDGAVTVTTDGVSIDVRTFTGRQLFVPTVTTYHEGTKITKTRSNDSSAFGVDSATRTGGSNEADNWGSPRGPLRVGLRHERRRLCRRGPY